MIAEPRGAPRAPTRVTIANRANMRTILLASVMAWAGVSIVHGQAYKWRDERGVVTYGQQPPDRSRAVPVDIHPNGAPSVPARDCIESPCAAVHAAGETQRLARERGERPGSAAEPAARGLDFDVYIRLKSGMSEGELLQRAGPPDFQSVENARGLIAKSFYYYPTTANPFTTIVSLRGGRIANIERIKKF